MGQVTVDLKAHQLLRLANHPRERRPLCPEQVFSFQKEKCLAGKTTQVVRGVLVTSKIVYLADIA